MLPNERVEAVLSSSLYVHVENKKAVPGSDANVRIRPFCEPLACLILVERRIFRAVGDERKFGRWAKWKNRPA